MYKNKFLYSIIFLLFSHITYAQTPYATIDPSQSANYCPGIFIQRDFTFSVYNVDKDSVKIDGNFTKGLTVVSEAASTGSGNNYIARLRFDDQWSTNAEVRLIHKRTNVVISSFQFTNVRSVNSLNAFNNNANSITQSIPSFCATSYNVTFTPAKYVRTGGQATNNLDRTTQDVNSFEYTLPSGVSPVSGLTLVSGSTYKGTYIFSIVPNPISRTTIEVRAINDASCPVHHI